MGIRFACHSCGKQLNIKAVLAGKRGVCPGCSARFRIPNRDSPTSTPLETALLSEASSGSRPAAESGVVSGSNPASVAQVDSSASGSSESGDALDLAPEAMWYVRPPGGGQYGPADARVMRDWIAEGRVAATALLWRDGWPQWRQADEALPGLLAGPSVAEAPAPRRNESIGEQRHAGAASATPDLAGAPDIGSFLGRQSSKRMGTIIGLSAVCIALGVALVWAIL